MEIEEATKLLAKLQTDVGGLLTEFSKATGLSVTSIGLDHTRVLGRFDRVISIDIEVKF